MVPDTLVQVLVLDNPGPEEAALVTDAVLEHHYKRRGPSLSLSMRGEGSQRFGGGRAYVWPNR